MAVTLASVRDQVELFLTDSSNLIWSTAVLDEAIRAALVDLSKVYGEDQTLKDLDAALTTTFEDQDVYVLVYGAVAYSLMFRSVGRYEEATPEPKIVPLFATMANDYMATFYGLLKRVNLRLKQLSDESPWAGWTWEETGGF